MGTVKELIEAYGLSLDEKNVIDLGWINGWGLGMHKICQYLKTMKLTTSGFSESIGVCQHLFGFKVECEEVVYQIIYRMDSGD